MAVLCERSKFLYIQVPGTGCSVVGVALQRELSGVSIGEKHDNVEKLLSKGVLAAQELSDLVVVANVRNPYDRLVTYFQRYKGGWGSKQSLPVRERMLARQVESGELSDKEIVRRNEELLKSAKKIKARERMFRFIGFNQWLWLTLLRWKRADSRSKNGSTKTDRMFPMLRNVDVALPQENLETSLNIVLEALGEARAINLPKKNLTPGKRSYASYYNGSARWIMNRLYGTEMQRLGYAFAKPGADLKPVALTEKGKRILE